MRARGWIASLLLVVATTSTRAGAAPAPTRVGTLVEAHPKVDGTMAGSKRQLVEKDGIWLNMEVATREGAQARIAIGGGSTVRGSLKMGEKSRVVFEECVVRQATGDRCEVELRALIGDFLLYLMPRPPAVLGRQGLVAGKVWIDTPAGLIELRGTAVCLRVEPDGTTTVTVLEGKVTAGPKVRVLKGSQTRVAPSFTSAAPRLVEDPPHFDLQRLFQLGNLPKARHP